MLRFLKGTAKRSLHIKPTTSLALTGFSDADWASDDVDRRSISEYCVFLSDSLISWSSRKQRVVARSSPEAEYRALASLASEIAWLKSLLPEMKFPIVRVPTQWCDNLSARVIATNPVLHARTKHVEIDLHFIRDKVLNKEVFFF